MYLVKYILYLYLLMSNYCYPYNKYGDDDSCDSYYEKMTKEREYYDSFDPDPEEEPYDNPEEQYYYDHMYCCGIGLENILEESFVDEMEADDISYLCIDCDENLTDNEIDARLDGGELDFRCDDCYGEHYKLGK